MALEDEEENILDVFKQWDTQGHGIIKADELKAMLKKLVNPRLKNTEIDEMLKLLDHKGNGRIKFEEFVQNLQ
ncbi:EF-hand domain-containing protein, partial [Salmonella sp. s51090]|uniref:EF-hand domain-containing protein n=1 Tax=Salmonella sp. s51090 TaxID=3159651 RepID=UPI0039812E0B